MYAYCAHQRVRGFSRRTIQRRTWALRLWAEYVEASGGLAAATVDQLETFLSRWAAATSRQAVRSDVRQFHRWAVERGTLHSDPTEKLPAPKLPRRAPTPIATHDVRRLIDTARGGDRLAIMLWAYAGLRASEIAGLRGEDIDLPARRLVVRGLSLIHI